MKIKKFFAAVVAAAVAVSAMAINAFASEDGTAYIMFSDANWTTQWWDDGNAYDNVTAETVKITGDGQYTVKATCAAPASSFAFAAVGVANGEVAFGAETLILTIDSVKIDGLEIQPSGTAYTSSDDAIVTRANLYNSWVSSLPDDARTANDASDMSATAYDLASIGEWTTMEVTFTVSGLGGAAATEEATTEEATTEEAAPVVEETTAAATGNTAAAAIVAVMAVAGTAAIASRKRK